MKFRLLSDLHIEFGPFDLPYCEGDEDTVLLLAGDVASDSKQLEIDALLIQAAEQFKAVVYIPGNHEFYGGDFPGAWHRRVKNVASLYLPNVHLIDQDAVLIGEFVIIGATMWTALDILPDTEWNVGKYMNDYHQVRDTLLGQKLTTARTKANHKQAVEYIFGMCTWARLQGLNPVVMTHHAPAPGSIALEFESDELNGGYYTDLTDRLVEYGPKLWVHGHMHNTFDYTVGDTRIVTNPRGYVMGERENQTFNPELVIEI